MTTGKAHIEQLNSSEVLGIVKTQNGRYWECPCFSWNQARHEIEDFCKLNQIALTEIPHRGGSSLRSGFIDQLQPIRF